MIHNVLFIERQNKSAQNNWFKDLVYERAFQPSTRTPL